MLTAEHRTALTRWVALSREADRERETYGVTHPEFAASLGRRETLWIEMQGVETLLRSVLDDGIYLVDDGSIGVMVEEGCGLRWLPVRSQ